MTKSLPNDVSLRLRAVGLQPSVVQALLSETALHLRHNGVEWTVGRLKEYKVDFVRLLGGLDPVGSYAKRSVRVQGTFYRVPKGVFGYLFRLGLCAGNSVQKIHRVWNALITYTGFVSPEVTWSQWKKFSTAVRTPPPSDTQLASASTYVQIGLRSLPKPPAYVGEPKPLITYQPREGKRRPTRKGGTSAERVGSVVMELNEIASDLGYTATVETVYPLFCEALFPVLKGTRYSRRDPFKATGPGRTVRNDVLHRALAWRRQLIGGTIGLIQEPGFKLRAVANPYRVYQLALEPLGHALFKWLRSIPEDCCFHQESGVFTIQGVMSEGGRTFHSLDLSNATDRFPLKLMMMLFRRMRVPKEALVLLLLVARGKWYLPPNSKISSVESIKWECGLPLGLYPCFALFSLAHHALIRGIFKSMGKEYSYRILGDDITIWDDAAAAEYERVMNEIGCSIAVAKTVHSDRVAEFAGRVILPHTILHGLKYGEEPNDNSFLELVKFLGPRTIRILKPKQRKVARFVSELPQPWGFGYNPRGIPYADRLAKAMAWEASSSPKVEQQSIAQIRSITQSYYAPEERSIGSYIKSQMYASDAIEQIASTSMWSREWSSFPAELFRGNVLAILDLQRLGVLHDVKGGWNPSTLRLVLRLTAPYHPDHPFNKPLVQSLHSRLLRTKELLSKTAW